MKQGSSLLTRMLLVVALSGLASACANAAVTIIGTHYQPDQYFPEFDCYWNASSYPASCRTPILGATVHVYVKNTGASGVTINDANLTTSSATYSLKTIIKKSVASWNPDEQNSIYFYWDNPPQDVFDAGEPVWYRFDPPTIPAGGVGQVAVRLRSIPVSQPVRLEVVTSGGNVATNIAVDANAPRVTSIGYSEDLRKVYVHWRRTGGAAPASVWLDGTNVTSLTTTVGDPTMNFGASVISLPNPLPFFSYHVFQGIYADGRTAAASQRAWTNKFIYATYCVFTLSETYTCDDWLAEAVDHGFNNLQVNLCGMCLGTAATKAVGYGYTTDDKTKVNSTDPDMWFLNDEPDAEEYNQSNTHKGTGLRLPDDSSHWVGTLAIKEGMTHTAEFRAVRPNVPTVVNLDGGLEPESFFTWGPAVDILQTDNYYEVRLKDSYLSYPNRIPLFNKALVSYAVARTACAGAEPNPSNHLLYSTKQATGPWPYPTPESKRFEAYYSLAGGSKGMGYWWLHPPNGLNETLECRSLWKEMGLVGNEIKTARNMIVKSTPVDVPITPSSKVWAHAVASGIDTLILYVVNDDYVNDINGCHYTNVPNATVTVTLPSWMQSSPTAFEITAGGLLDVSTQRSGNQLQVNLGTLKLTRMIVLTTDPQLRTATQQRYDEQVRPHVCNIAPELCVTYPPSIAQQPTSQAVILGATAVFTVVAGGTSPLSYRWQKNNSNLNDGGHYSGSATPTLTITGADGGDVAGYRCVVTSPYGTTNSLAATLTLATYNPCLDVLNPDFESGFLLAGGGYIATNWTEWEADPNVVIGFDESTIIHGDAHSQRIRVSGGASGTSGGVYQRVPVVTGQPFNASVWTYAGDNLTACYLGVDPAGGTDPNSGVTWSSANTNSAWVQKTVSGSATASFITLYLKVASADSVKRNGYFDDAIPQGCGNNAPGITQQPMDQSVLAGETASFTVLASGTDPLSYQWQKNNLNLEDRGHLSGCTTPILIISDTDSNDVASYRCVVTNTFGITNSASASLTVTNPTIPPSIRQQPLSQNIPVGGTASFTISAAGSEPLSYQWQKNSSNLGDDGHYSGVTTPILTITGADNNDTANYRCGVTNTYGSTNSAAAMLTIIAPNDCANILNAGFENGFSLAGGGYIANDWTEWEASPGVVIGYDETAIVHGGAHSQRIRVSSTGATSGGVYQRIPVTAGNVYAVSVWMRADDALTACSLGVDPAGGTNADSGVTWSSASTDLAWVQKSWAGTALSDHLTVYFKVTSPDNVKRSGYFDDAAPTTAPLNLVVQRNGDALTLTWPECPNARLERVGSLTPPVVWATATNQINSSGGQKSVTLSPTDNVGFFRLVQE